MRDNDNIMNRLANVANRFQGEAPRVLCVCSAGLLRSPTAAVVLSQDPFNFNTRAVGSVPEYALVPLDIVLIDWSDFIFTMDSDHEEAVLCIADANERFLRRPPVVCNLDIPDRFEYSDPELRNTIITRAKPHIERILDITRKNRTFLL